MILSSGYVKTHRQLQRDVFKLIDAQAKRQEQKVNGRLVLRAIWDNVGYEQAVRGGRFEPYKWDTTHREIADFTALSVGQVRRTLAFLKSIRQGNRQGKNSLMLLELQTLTATDKTYPTGTAPNRRTPPRLTDRVGISIKALFLQRFEQGDKTYPTDVSEPNRRVITENKNKSLKKRDISLLADPVLCTPTEPTWSEQVKVKSGLVQEDTHRSLASSPELQSNNAIEQAPVHVSEPIAETKRTADTKATGQAHLTAQRGGITLEQAKEQYPQLERGVKYLTYLNKLGVVFYPTHLDAFYKAIQIHDNKPEPNAHDKPIAQALRRFGRERAKCDTVEQALERAKQQQVLEYFVSEPEQRQEYAWGGR